MHVQVSYVLFVWTNLGLNFVGYYTIVVTITHIYIYKSSKITASCTLCKLCPVFDQQFIGYKSVIHHLHLPLNANYHPLRNSGKYCACNYIRVHISVSSISVEIVERAVLRQLLYFTYFLVFEVMEIWTTYKVLLTDFSGCFWWSWLNLLFGSCSYIAQKFGTPL